MTWRDRAALSVAQVAAELGVAKLHVQRMIDSGELRHIRVAGITRVPTRALLELLGEAEPEAPAESPPATAQARRGAERILDPLRAVPISPKPIGPPNVRVRKGSGRVA